MLNGENRNTLILGGSVLPENSSNNEKKLEKQKVKSYERTIELVEYVCACPDCSYCGNKVQTGHPNRKWCCYEAMLESRKKRRARKAREEGRMPGKVGRPKQDE